MKKQLLLGVTLFSLALTAVGCGTSTTENFQSTINFNGSSTLTPVISKISDDFKTTYGSWQDVDKAFPNEPITLNVTSGGSGQGVKAVIEKTSDFGMVARSVKDDEKAQLETMAEYQVGIDALTIAVHPNSPLLTLKDDLSKDEIVKLFSGEYKLWSDFDASLPSEEIIVVTRDIGGGAHEVFQSKIMGDTDVTTDAIQAPSMGALVQKITENEYTIGYASFGVVNQNTGKVVPLQVDGVAPTEEHIKDGSYIIQRPLILIADAPLSTSETALLQYIQSEAGLAVVEELGFIPVQP
ncbi:MAG: phosphate ABC transporter substrate-binding protein [Cellulosilyticaceae bacterium]